MVQEIIKESSVRQVNSNSLFFNSPRVKGEGQRVIYRVLHGRKLEKDRSGGGRVVIYNGG